VLQTTAEIDALKKDMELAREQYDVKLARKDLDLLKTQTNLDLVKKDLRVIERELYCTCIKGAPQLLRSVRKLTFGGVPEQKQE